LGEVFFGELKTSREEIEWVGKVGILSIGDIAILSEVYGSDSIPAQGLSYKLGEGVFRSWSTHAICMYNIRLFCINVQMHLCINV
jgi:hypothetical protein